jgi:hypothetical protein
MLPSGTDGFLIISLLDKIYIIVLLLNICSLV